MKTRRNIGKIRHLGPFLNNKVDKNVQSMLFPLNLIQYIVFHPKYRIKNNVISPNSRIANFVSMVATLVSISAFIHCTYVGLTNKQSIARNTVMVSIALFTCFFYSFGFTINFVIGLIQSKSNVKFVLTFQKVHRFINNDTDVNHINIWIWIDFLVVLVIYFIVFTYLQIKMGAPFSSAYTVYFLIIFDVNIIYVIRIIRLLTNKVDLWNSQHLNLPEREDIPEINCCTRLFQAYVDILECYNIHKDSFQQFVSNLPFITITY